MSLSRHYERSNRPRVVHVTTAHRADDVRIFERQCRSLADSGRYDVLLAASGSIPDGSGVRLIPLASAPSSRTGRFSSGPGKALALTLAVAADLWHFHDPELLPVALLLALSGRRVIWDAHEDYVAQFSQEGAKNWVPAALRGFVRLGTGTLLGAVDRRASGVVAATPHIASRYSNPQTVLVGNEARLETYRDCRPDFNSRQVLFTGSPVPGHLFDEVVRAIAMVPDVRLAVAGREPDPVVWSRASVVLGDRIHHLGWLDRPAVARAMSASTLGLSTYADVPTNAENSPNKLFEFAAAGLPVVATPTKSNEHFLTASGAGVVASGFGPDEIAAAIGVALADRTAWEMASAAGRQWAAREGDWSASQRRLLNLYADILSRDVKTTRTGTAR